MLPKYEDLTTVNRGAPCEQFPGTYYIYVDGAEKDTLSGEVGEYVAIEQFRQCVQEHVLAHRISLCWEASDNDPRIGQVWFTGFYTVAEG
jgi:hypothetical protein